MKAIIIAGMACFTAIAVANSRVRIAEIRANMVLTIEIMRANGELMAQSMDDVIAGMK